MSFGGVDYEQPKTEQNVLSDAENPLTPSDGAFMGGESAFGDMLELAENDEGEKEEEKVEDDDDAEGAESEEYEEVEEEGEEEMEDMDG